MPKQRYAPRPHGRMSAQVEFLEQDDLTGEFKSAVRYTAPFHSRLYRHKSLGLLTGALRPAYPKMFRPYGTNTRETVAKLKNTGILDNTYDKDIVSPGARASSFVDSRAVLAQSGAPSIVGGIRSLQPGSNHWLFDV